MTANFRFASPWLILLAAGCTTVNSPNGKTVTPTTSVTPAKSSASVDADALSVLSDEDKKYANFARQSAKALDGYANEQFILAGMHERGQGTPRSYTEAAKWYRLAADQGHAEAQFYLGAMYGSSRGVDRSFKAAVWWYSKSAAQGYRDAFFPMAFANEYGIGVPANLPLAIEWYLKSADAGVWQAAERLGKAYKNGELGLAVDADKAKEWFTKSVALKAAASSAGSIK